MSREIKFKAYIKKLAIVVPVQRINFDCSTVEVKLDEGDFWEFDFEEVELMEFPGLHDKNDIEVYEGDIIFINDILDEPNGDGDLYLAQWETLGFAIRKEVTIRGPNC